MMVLNGLPVVSAPLPWHSQIWNRFNQQLQENTLPHALLLTGVQHSGKARLALALARLLLCRQPNGGLNCGQCHACELSASGSHGDFRWLQPEEKSRVIKIEQVREVVNFTTKTASFGQRKVVVLSPADSMNTNAANALLKSLEEPSPDTFLILVCHQLHRLPATIRSRCQIIKLPAPAAEESLGWLDQLTGERAESERLLDLSDEMPLLAEAIYRQPDAKELLAARLACRALVTGKFSTTEIVGMLADAPTEEVLEQLMTVLQSQLRSMDPAVLKSSRGQAVFALLDEIGGIHRAVTGGANPNRQLIAEVLAGKVQDVLGGAGPDVSIGSSQGRSGQ